MRRQFNRQARTAEQHRQPQRHHGMPAHRFVAQGFGHFFQIAALPQGNLRQQFLLLPRKAGHVRLRQNVGRVFMVGRVGNVNPDFVQQGRPAHIMRPIFQFLHGGILRQAV